MTATTPAISPLRQRMIDDMRLRKLADKTQSHYLRAVRQFSLFLGHSPDRATIEDLRRYQLHLVDQGISAISLNAAIIGLKFFFDVTLDHPQLMRKMQLVRIPRTLPVVLSREEVASVDALVQAFDSADADNDGLLTPEEYTAFVANTNGANATPPADGGFD